MTSGDTSEQPLSLALQIKSEFLLLIAKCLSCSYLGSWLTHALRS